MTQFVTCPACGHVHVSVCSYEAMMMLRQDMALFSVRCPECGTHISTLQTVPEALRDEIAQAAAQIGAGMGRE